jgi:hypothetical protein
MKRLTLDAKSNTRNRQRRQGESGRKTTMIGTKQGTRTGMAAYIYRQSGVARNAWLYATRRPDNRTVTEIVHGVYSM